MNQKLKIGFFLVLGLITSWVLFGQEPKKKPIEYKGSVFLSDKITESGKISVPNFLQLIKDSIWVKDLRDGKFYRASNFRITYAERGDYEDEFGKPIVVTDYFFSNCHGIVDTGMYSNLYYKSKPGDTVFIEQTMFRNIAQKDILPQAAHSIKLILTR